MAQPQDLTEKDWADIHLISVEVSAYLQEVVEHQRSQLQWTTPLSPCARERAQRVARTSPTVNEESVSLSPSEADRIARERLNAFQQKGVRIRNLPASSDPTNAQQKWKDLQDRRWQ